MAFRRSGVRTPSAPPSFARNRVSGCEQRMVPPSLLLSGGGLDGFRPTDETGLRVLPTYPPLPRLIRFFLVTARNISMHKHMKRMLFAIFAGIALVGCAQKQ